VVEFEKNSNTLSLSIFMVNLPKINPLKNQSMKKLLIALLFSLLQPAYALDETKTYTFAITPDRDREDLVILWQSVIDYLSKTTQLNLTLKVPTTMKAFDAGLTQQQYDISYITPYQYVQQEQYYLPVIRQQDKNTVVILFGNQHHKAKKLKDFDQQTILFTNENASVIPIHQLTQEKASITPRYIKNQETIYRTIALGLYDYASGDLYSFQQLRPSLQAKLSLIWQSSAYTGHALVVKNDLTELQKTLSQALLDWSNTIEGQQQLKRLQLDNLIPAKAEDWDDIRALMPAPVVKKAQASTESPKAVEPAD